MTNQPADAVMSRQAALESLQKLLRTRSSVRYMDWARASGLTARTFHAARIALMESGLVLRIPGKWSAYCVAVEPEILPRLDCVVKTVPDRNALNAKPLTISLPRVRFLEGA